MTLIADGGSTKCDWVLLDHKGDLVFKTRTPGLNPTVVSEDELLQRIKSNPELSQVFEHIEELDFYGAGCGTSTPKAILQQTLKQLFVNATITVAEDMLAAALAVTDKPGIVCIFGTGSNSCFFDGKTAKTQVESLGYILMDEASGNYYGKRLIRDYFYKKMPSKLAAEFEKRFDLNPDTIKINLYKKPNPNTYLASFAEFIFTSEEENAYFYNLISEGVLKFIEDKILCYKEAQQVPIHFIGSIAHFSQDIIRDCLSRYNLQLGNIVRRPIDGLIAYYRKNRFNS